jgi:hypothetical protein
MSCYDFIPIDGVDGVTRVLNLLLSSYSTAHTRSNCKNLEMIPNRTM